MSTFCKISISIKIKINWGFQRGAAPLYVEEIILQCWAQDHTVRPSFEDILKECAVILRDSLNHKPPKRRGFVHTTLGLFKLSP